MTAHGDSDFNQTARSGNRRVKPRSQRIGTAQRSPSIASSRADFHSRPRRSARAADHPTSTLCAIVVAPGGDFTARSPPGAAHSMPAPPPASCDESGHKSRMSRDMGLSFGSLASGRALRFGCASGQAGIAAAPTTARTPGQRPTGRPSHAHWDLQHEAEGKRPSGELEALERDVIQVISRSATPAVTTRSTTLAVTSRGTSAIVCGRCQSRHSVL